MENNKKIIIFTLAGILSVLTATADVMVTFTLSTDDRVDSGLTYDNFHEADAGINNDGVFVVGFNVDIHTINGENVDVSPVAAFCSELEESIYTGDHTFEAMSLSYLAAGRAGEAKTASSAIPEGGIGHQRAQGLLF